MAPLRVLLSAYACEPGKGSEPGVGWNWALALARRGHEVWVITRSNNRSLIEQELPNLDYAVRTRLHFIYYDLPAWARWWKKGRRGVHLYYLLWQWGAYRMGRHWHSNIAFDLVHHVTFVSARQPSFMGNLGIPFVFGPVAGGERAPLRLRYGYSWHGWVNDFLRDVSNTLIQFDPLVRRAFQQAVHIYATTKETYSLIPRRHQHKASIQLAIALEQRPGVDLKKPPPRILNPSALRILYVGQFVSWKGVQFGIQAFAKLQMVYPDTRLTIVGKGFEDENWRRLAKNLKVDHHITWIPWMPQSKLATLYCDHDVFLFPSLHDSGGMVVLEAMSYGLPVICLDLGGPAVMVDPSCGRVINVTAASGQLVVQRILAALIECSNSPDLVDQLGKGALARSLAFSWDQMAHRIYGPLETTATK